MTNAEEKRINRIAERKGFRLDKAGNGKGHGRFYIVNLTEAHGCVPAYSPRVFLSWRRPRRGLL